MLTINEQAKKNFYKSFERNEKTVQDDVKIIKEWLKTQPHLPEIMEDVKIRNFLNLNKFSIEKTKKKIDMYYTIRTILPEFFEKTNPKLENVKEVFNTSYLSVFEKPLNELNRVYFSKKRTFNKVNIFDIMNVWFAIFEVRLYEDFMVDDIIIVDMEYYSLNDIKGITPSFLLNCQTINQKVYSLRIKKVYFLNCPSYISVLVAVLKSVTKPKIFERLEFHKDTAILKTVLPPDMLPKDYGGEGPSLHDLNDMMQKKFAEYQTRFDILDTLKVNEKLRPEKLNNDDVLGYYGNFKKIDVD